jgi:hypothetical protein
MNKIIIDSIAQTVVNKLQEKEQALNGWVAIDADGVATATGNFCGIKVMAGVTATVTLTFSSTSPCVTNSVTIDLLQGDYLPTPGLTSVEVTAGKVFCIKSQL